jgi:hypothetical protein
MNPTLSKNKSSNCSLTKINARIQKDHPPRSNSASTSITITILPLHPAQSQRPLQNAATVHDKQKIKKEKLNARDQTEAVQINFVD